MKNRFTFFIILFLLIGSIVGCITYDNGDEFTSNMSVYYVDRNGSADFISIQGVINTVNETDKIIVLPRGYIQKLLFPFD